MRQQACAAIACLFVSMTGVAMGQSPDFTADESRVINAVDALISDGTYPEEILDIASLCPVLLARPVAELVASLEGEGWMFDLSGLEGSNPFFSSYQGYRTYDRLFAAGGGFMQGELYLGYEDYPGGKVDYCAFTYLGSTKEFALSALAGVLDGNVAVPSAQEQYASWAVHLDGRDYFARAELSSEMIAVHYTTHSLP